MGPAMLCVLIISTLDGWVAILFEAMDAYAIDHQPSTNVNVRNLAGAVEVERRR